MDSALQRERFAKWHEGRGFSRGEALAPVLRRAQAWHVFRADESRGDLPATICLVR